MEHSTFKQNAQNFRRGDPNVCAPALMSLHSSSACPRAWCLSLSVSLGSVFSSGALGDGDSTRSTR